MLVLIGRGWADARNEAGQRRLEDANDFVRLEISAALKRNIPVTPILLQGARMPAADRLPDDIKDLPFRNGFEVSHSRWESDVREMVRRLGLETATPPIEHPAGKTPPEVRRRGGVGTGGEVSISLHQPGAGGPWHWQGPSCSSRLRAAVSSISSLMGLTLARVVLFGEKQWPMIMFA
jgi:hypothetical protein